VMLEHVLTTALVFRHRLGDHASSSNPLLIVESFPRGNISLGIFDRWSRPKLAISPRTDSTMRCAAPASPGGADKNLIRRGGSENFNCDGISRERNTMEWSFARNTSVSRKIL
jgi:hypothetical protein